jgi:hypothetical protein
VSTLSVAAAAGLVAAAVPVASLPGLLAAVVLALRPPPPTALRVVGWTLVAVTLATAALVLLLV